MDVSEPSCSWFLQACVTQCFPEVMVMLGLADGKNQFDQCNVPLLDDGFACTQVSAGTRNTVLLRSEGSAVVCGKNDGGQCNIPRKFLQGGCVQYFSEVMAILWLAGGTFFDNATFHVWKAE